MTVRMTEADVAMQAQIKAEADDLGWNAARLSDVARVSVSTANAVLRGRPVIGRTLYRCARAVGLDVEDIDAERDPSAIGRQCEEADLPAVRYVLRQAIDEVRMTATGRGLLVQAGRLAGMPEGWESLPVADFEP